MRWRDHPPTKKKIQTKPKILPREYKRHYYSIKFSTTPPNFVYVTLIYCAELTDKPFHSVSFQFLSEDSDTSCRTFSPILLLSFFFCTNFASTHAPPYYHVTHDIRFVFPWQGARFLYFSPFFFSGYHSAEEKNGKNMYTTANLLFAMCNQRRSSFRNRSAAMEEGLRNNTFGSKMNVSGRVGRATHSATENVDIQGSLRPTRSGINAAAYLDPPL